MYPHIIKWSGVSGLVYIVFAVYFLHPMQVFASGRTESASEVLSVSEAHVEKILEYRMRGSDIKILQEELRILPLIYPSGKVTGYFGTATLAAVTRFQKQEQISRDMESTSTTLGVVDMRTHTLIRLRVIEKKCPQETRSRSKCLEENYAYYAKHVGVDGALNVLRAEVAFEPQFEGMCHQAMHHIAHIAVHQFKNFGNAMYHGTTLCQNGYYHGVVEEYLRNENVDALTPNDLRNFCSTSLVATSSRTDTLNCVHGIGHALMYMTRNNLPKSLIRCGDFWDGHMRSQCLTGAFMQAGFVATSSKKSDVDKQVLSCTQSQDQDECYISLSAKVMSEKSADKKQVELFCDTLTDTKIMLSCKSVVTNTNN